MTAPTPKQLAYAWQQAVMDTGFSTTPDLTAVVRGYFERGFEYGYQAAALRTAADQLEAVRAWLDGQDSAEWDAVDLDGLDRILNGDSDD